jgi:hypothetical protein
MTSSEKNRRSAKIVDFRRYANSSKNVHQEALRFQSIHGPNIYTDYLLKHRSRPDISHAASIGKVMGLRVRASDGSMQPSLSQEEKALRVKAQKSSIEKKHIDLELSRACHAISYLAQNNLEPKVLMGRLSPLEEQTVDTELENAVKWLVRFAKERCRHGQSRIVKVKE